MEKKSSIAKFLLMKKLSSIANFFLLIFEYLFLLYRLFLHIYKNISVSELTPSLSVTELQINVSNLDYIELGEKLQPTKNVVTINSNFVHKVFTSYEQFL